MPAVLLAACAAIAPQQIDPQMAVLVVNGSQAEVDWIVEQPDGLAPFRVEQCSSHSNAVDVGRAWRVEVDGRVVADSDHVVLTDAAVTSIRVDIAPGGAVRVSGPTGSDRIPDAPMPPACVGG